MTGGWYQAGDKW